MGILLLLAALLPTGWRVAPAGAEVALDTFPVHAALMKDGRHALVLHSGFRPASLALVDLAARKVLKTLVLKEAGTSFHFDLAAGRVYVPLGHRGSVAVVRVGSGMDLELEREIALEGHASTVAGAEGLLAVTLNNAVAIVDAASGQVVRRLEVKQPARTLFHGRHLYVLSKSPAALRVFARDGWTATGTVTLAAGPSDLLAHGGALYVAAGDTNLVEVLDLTNAGAPKTLERLNLAPGPGWPVGMTPASLQIDAETGRIYVACSDANAVAVLDVKTRRVTGYVPAGWYPTFALPLPGAGLLVLNGKGERSYPNRKGPNPTVHRTMTPQPPSEIEYTPLVQTGTGRVVEGVTAKVLAGLTRSYARLTPALQTKAKGRVPKEIRHVIYIMKENRTYDQVLGDLEKGNGDAALCLFPEKVTPNHHKLAREFVLFDNFYVNADVSAEGWMWTSAAIVPRFTMLRWPAAYAGRTRPQAAEAMDAPPGGFLWTSALRAGLSYRNYGFFVSNRAGAKPGEPIVAAVSDPALMPHTNPRYAGYDPGFPDIERARIFLEEFQEFEKKGELPRLMTLVLPNDHTWGTAPGKLTPFSSMADNDLALGRIVEAVSKSRFWANTAIFVVEDDAQNGPDHVDSHRSPAYVISPYTRRGAVDSTFYNTTSMLRTIEQILGLGPLTHYDGTSEVMRRAFQGKADLRPYTAEAARVPLAEMNPERAPTAGRSLRLDLTAPDRMEDAEMNSILWLSVKGVEAPAPTRAAFLN